MSSSKRVPAENGFLNKRQLRIAKTIGAGRDRGSLKYFNNGEPLAMAVKKICAQLIFVIIIFAIVITAAWGKMTLSNYLSNDSIFSLTMSSKYSQTVSADNIQSFSSSDNSGAAALNTVAASFGTPGVSLDTSTKYTYMMKNALVKAFGEDNVEYKSNISNYDMMTKIYESLANGDAVICQAALSSDEKAASADEFVYVVVTSANFSSDEIVIQTPYGQTRTMSGDDFIAATRFTNKKSNTITEWLSMIFGLRSKNTVFFISHE